MDRMTFISVDIETAGPTPSDYALLAIGACLVHEPDTAFYAELIPDRERIDPSAVKISGLDPAKLKTDGRPAQEVMEAFEKWLQENIPSEDQAIFIAFNAAFDWMFVADYFHRYLDRNPFGHRALDLKALYMGLYGVGWNETSMAEVSSSLGLPVQLSHNALEDARDQAKIFNALLKKLQNSSR